MTGYRYRIMARSVAGDEPGLQVVVRQELLDYGVLVVKPVRSPWKEVSFIIKINNSRIESFQKHLI